MNFLSTIDWEKIRSFWEFCFENIITYGIIGLVVGVPAILICFSPVICMQWPQIGEWFNKKVKQKFGGKDV